jgi:hypothetical protein
VWPGYIEMKNKKSLSLNITLGPVAEERRKIAIAQEAARTGVSEQDIWLKHVEVGLNEPFENESQSSLLAMFVSAYTVGERLVIIEPVFTYGYVDGVFFNADGTGMDFSDDDEGEWFLNISIELDKIRDLHGRCLSYDWSNQKKLNDLAAAIGGFFGSYWNVAFVTFWNGNWSKDWRRHFSED